MRSQKTIYLARHAKSSWNSGAETDFERPLSNKGIADAVRMGEELNSLGWKPDVVISSPAVRAKQTSYYICQKLGYSTENVLWNKDIYSAYVVTLLQILSVQSETIKSVMLVGHNPAMEELLLHFCHDANSHRQKNGKLFTTGNVVKITLESSWKDVAMCEAILDQVLRPKDL